MGGRGGSCTGAAVFRPTVTCRSPRGAFARDFDKSGLVVGGLGSTRWSAHRRRATVDEAPLRIRAQWLADRLRGDQRAAHGNIRFSRDLDIEFELSPDVDDRRLMELRLAASRAGSRKVLSHYRVAMHAARQPLGGRRWWFFCPECRTRRQTLYVAPENYRWTCRSCAGLAYTSQRLRHSGRLALRAEKLAIRAKVEWDPDDLPPDRPRGMHRRTFKRRLAALKSVQAELDADFHSWLRRRFGEQMKKQLAAEFGSSADRAS